MSTAIVSLKAPGSRQILQEAAPRWTDASTAPGSRVHDCNLLGVGDPNCAQMAGRIGTVSTWNILLCFQQIKGSLSGLYEGNVRHFMLCQMMSDAFF